MAWRIEFEESAKKELAKLDRQEARRIVRFLREQIEPAEDPRRVGKPLKGTLAGLWRYRVGNYRIVARIQDDRLLVLVVRIGHRREVYR